MYKGLGTRSRDERLPVAPSTSVRLFEAIKLPRSPAWHRRARSRRSSARAALRCGRRPSKLALCALALHHSTEPSFRARLCRLMGRGDKWNRPQQGGHYDTYRQPQGGRQESQRPWRVWPGAFSPSGRQWSRQEQAAFPRYDARPPPSTSRPQDNNMMSGGTMEDGASHLVNDVQSFINMARKAENRVKSLTSLRQQREAQWTKYVHDMKATLQNEHQRFQQSLAKLDEDLHAAHQNQEDSRKRLCHVIEVSMGRRQPEGRPTDQQWEEMVNRWEQESATRNSPMEVVQRAFTGAPPPDFGPTPPPMPAPIPPTGAFNLDPAWGTFPAPGLSAEPPGRPPQPVPPDAYYGTGPAPGAHVPAAPMPPAPHSSAASPGARERADGARGPVKAHTPPKKVDSGASLGIKLEAKRNALKPFGGPPQGTDPVQTGPGPTPASAQAATATEPDGGGTATETAGPANSVPVPNQDDELMEFQDLS